MLHYVDELHVGCNDYQESGRARMPSKELERVSNVVEEASGTFNFDYMQDVDMFTLKSVTRQGRRVQRNCHYALQDQCLPEGYVTYVTNIIKYGDLLLCEVVWFRIVGFDLGSKGSGLPLAKAFAGGERMIPLTLLAHEVLITPQNLQELAPLCSDEEEGVIRRKLVPNDWLNSNNLYNLYFIVIVV
jgi:hypothetical protein